MEVVVWDHAPGHRAKCLQVVDVPRVRLVSYAQESNPAELIGEVIRVHTEGIVYPSLWAKMAAVEQVLTALAAYPEAIRRFCGWECIFRECEQLPSGLN